MPVKEFRPFTPVQRYKSVLDFTELTKKDPEKSLTEAVRKKGGRNSNGHVTMRHRGGGARQRYRIIDFKRDKVNVPGVVASIEYDPNRSAHIALISYRDGEKRYILQPDTLAVGQTIVSGPEVEIQVGNAMPLSRVPLGMFVHNIELRPGKGAQLAKTAGVYAEVVAKESPFVQLKLPSGEIRNFPQQCYATLGQVGNQDHEKITLGSAGRTRHLGWRPHVRGVCMNPVDHPNGGGEGRSKSGGGWQQLTSPWGNMVKGQKTRKRKKASNRFIVRRRKGKK